MTLCSRCARVLGALAAGAVLCAFHMSHAEREACASAQPVFAAPSSVVANPAACLGTQRL